ncbi:MAG: hypothetical protein AAFZ65_21200, partial [Planctomycetota bacterium]
MLLASILAAAATAVPQDTLVENFNTASTQAEPDGDPEALGEFGSRLFFAAETLSQGVEPWITDGTAEGTTSLGDLVPGLSGSSVNEGVALDGSRYLFIPNASLLGREVFITDGTPEGTEVLVDLVPGAGGSDPAHLVLHNGEVYFYATAAGSQSQLWKTDGTAAGTLPLGVATPPGFLVGGPPMISTSMGLFYARAGGQGWQLLVTDGSPGGATVLQQTAAAPFNGPNYFAEQNGVVYFAADDAAAGIELWRSDGTPEGTWLIDVAPGAGDASPRELTPFNGEVFFSASTGGLDRNLWKTDGTPEGTVPVIDVVTFPPPLGGTNPTELTAFGDQLVFVASLQSVGTELFATNGEVG